MKYSTKFNIFKKISNNLNAFTNTIYTYWLYYTWVFISIPCTSFIFSLSFIQFKRKTLFSRISWNSFENKYTTNNKIKKKKLYKNSFSKTIIQYNIHDTSVPSIMNINIPDKFTLLLHKHEFIIFKKILAEQFERYYWQDCVGGEGVSGKSDI